MGRTRRRVTSPWWLTLGALVLLGCGRGCASRSASPGAGAGSPPPSAAAPGPSKEPEKAAQAPTARPAESDADPAERARLADRARALATVSHSIVDHTPRDHEDPNLIVQHTGPEPEAILRWVRQSTTHLAYRGLLRGAPGVLMDRAGNSLDRAVFAADLLKRRGHVVRLARTTLPLEKARALRVGLAARKALPSLPPPSDPAELLRTFAGVPLPAGTLDTAVRRVIREEEAFRAEVQDLQTRVFPALAAALGPAERTNAALAIEAEQTLADHFWVQRQVGVGWEDLDPDAELLGNLTATTTLAPDQIPDDLRHRVTLRLLFEARRAGAVSNTMVLERSWAVADLLGKSFSLGHRLYPEPPMNSIVASPDPAAAYLQALRSVWVIEPVLRLGDEDLTDRLYTLRGEALPADQATKSRLGFSAGPVGAIGAKMATGFTQAFGGAAPAGPPKAPDESAEPTRITAEWLELEVRVPGRPLEQHRRAVFDLVDPSARATGSSAPPPIDDRAREKRGLALLGEVAGVITGSTPSADWLTRLTARQTAEGLEHSAGFLASPGALSDRSRLVGGERLPVQLWTWASSRAQASTLPPAPPTAPNVALLWTTPVGGRGRDWTVQVGFDIVTNRTGSDFDFSSRVAQGVLDTAVERALFPGSRKLSNTAALHALDLASGRPWVRLGPGESSRVAQLDVSAEAKSRIQDDLQRGFQVVARARTTRDAPSAAWWRVDPLTGTTVGMGENGRGTEGAEDLLTTGQVVRGFICFCITWAFIIHDAEEGSGAGAGASAAAGAMCFMGAAHHWGGFIGATSLKVLVELIFAQHSPGEE